MLILKENAANSVPTPPVGKDTFFIDDSGTPSVKNAAGTVTTFPTTSASNAQVLFMNGTAITGDAQLTYNYNTDVLTVTGNVAATRVLTDNLLYANGTAWDLQQPAGSNTQIQYNNNSDFGASANFTFNSSTNVLTVTGNISTGNVSATGLVSGATVAGSLTTAAQPNITSVGTLTSLAVTGNITSGNVYANSGTIGASLVAGTLTTAAQPNVTSVGTLTGLGVNGNITAANITANTGVFTGNGSGLSAIAGANVTGTVSSATTAGTVTTAAQPNITSVGTLSSLSVTGNVTGGNLNATSAVVASTLTSNVATGTAPLTVTSTTRVANLNVATAGVANTVNDAAQPNITSVGTLTSVTVTGTATAGNLSTGGTLSVTGNANVGNLGTAGLITATGNVSGGNLTTAGALSVTGNANVGNIGAAAGVFTTVAGTLTTAAQPNVTSVGTLSSLAVTGNATAGNVYANSGTVGASVLAGTLSTASQPNITSVGTLGSLAVTSNVTAGNVYANSGTIGASLLTGTLTTAAQPNITSVGTLSSLAVTGNVAAGNLTTTGVLSVTGTGVSSIAGNLDMTSNTIINLATPTNSTDAATKQYVDDVAQGLNIHDAVAAATPTTLATITGGTITYNNGTAGVGANLTTTGSFNLIDGVNVQTAGTRILVKNEANAVLNGIYTWSNATVITRATDYDSIPEVEAGDFVFCTGGTLYDNTGWVQTDSPTGIGTAGNVINFTQFSGAGTYTAGTGLTLTGSTFSVNASQTQITSVGTLTGLNSSSTITAPAFTANTGVFTGNGSGLSAIAGANVTGTVSSATTAGTVTTAAQPNITSVGTLTSLSVTGNITAGNVSATTFTGALSGAATTAGTVTTAAQPNITSVGTLTSLSVTGNVAAGNLNATSAVVASTLTSNIATGTAPLTVTSTTLVPNLYVARANVSDFDAITLVSTGTYYPQFVSGTSGNLASAANAVYVANIANGSFAATTFVGALSGAATTAGTVTTAAQPNITSVGTLTSLTVSGNITAQANVTVSGYSISSVGTGISAAGSSQGTGTALTKDINVVSTVASGAGVVLPTAIAGMRISIVNTSANALLVYPASGGAINSLATNASFSEAAGARLDFVATSTTQWYTLNATYA